VNALGLLVSTLSLFRGITSRIQSEINFMPGHTTSQLILCVFRHYKYTNYLFSSVNSHQWGQLESFINI
jgi:hypothetical protein